jgi:hypothetical protein
MSASQIPLVPSGKSPLEAARPVADQEGRIAIVTNVGHGMRWTRCRQLTSDDAADGEVVWS